MYLLYSDSIHLIVIQKIQEARYNVFTRYVISTGAIIDRKPVENHEYQLYLAIEDIDHTKIKARSPQTNGICERFHKTVLNEFYMIAFRKKVYNSLDELQTDLDIWIKHYNEERPHTGKYCYGKTPMETFLDSKHIAKEKQLDSIFQASSGTQCVR